MPAESEAIVAGMLNLRVEYAGKTLNVRGNFMFFLFLFSTLLPVVQGRELASRNSDGMIS